MPLSRPILFLLACLLPWSVEAAGWMPFGGYAPSAAALGSAYAGMAAMADNASIVAANPAGMTVLGGNHISLGGQWQFTNISPQISGASSSDIAQDQTTPYLYVTRALSDTWSLGLAVNSPYAFETRYDAGWPGESRATLTRVQSRNFNPAVAYRASEQVSLALGLNYQTLKLNWENTGSLYEASGSGLGWNAGATVQLSPAMRLGFAYRSPIRHELKGELGGVSGNDSVVETPDSFTFAVWQQYSDQWEASGEMGYVRWSRLDRLQGLPQEPAFAYRDAWRFAWGAAYRHNERLKSRFGIAVDRSPVLDDNRTARLPEGNAVWLTLGLQYRVYRAGLLDAGLAYRLPSSPAIGNGVNGEYRVSDQVLGLQYSHAY